ncbi:hypothetical protein TYRP_013802 [Tyrophagus putrescentiae]|nr:hypothetical protein TYRP_013802 [Tyrophagus putrescentiae]
MAARSGTHLYTLNFRCLGSRERSERDPRRRKFKVYKRCRVSRRGGRPHEVPCASQPPHRAPQSRMTDCLSPAG